MRVLGITTSDGSLTAQYGAQKVVDLLQDLHHEGIPVGVSEHNVDSIPNWRSFSRSIVWGSGSKFSVPLSSSQKVIERAFQNTSQDITLVALGSLTTYAQFIASHPECSKRIERIVWYNESILTEGYNYNIDSAAYNFVRSSNISLEIVSLNRDDILFSSEYASLFSRANSRYSRQIKSVYLSGNVQSRIKNHALLLWDDLVPLYITNSILFDEKTLSENCTSHTLISFVPNSLVYSTLISLYESGENPETQLFSKFPVRSELYVPKYATMVDSTIAKFGQTEWKAMVLTNEIHGHIGIYSIIGAKIGVRACEFFNVGANNIEIVSYAGSRPPLSCFNDGVQISTGATIGQGLIEISDTVLSIPTIVCRCNGYTVEFAVTKEIALQMQLDIKKGVRLYGNLTPDYWNYVEELARVYWTTFNRHDIFDVNFL
jgi:pyrimidine-specific ribonucleoside hydrolase